MAINLPKVSTCQKYIGMKNPWNNQIHVKTTITRNLVTMTAYLKCKRRASSRSNAIAILVPRETPHKTMAEQLKLEHIRRNVASGKSWLYPAESTIDKSKGCTMKPKAKSDKARPANKIWAGECKDGVLKIVIKIAAFPSRVITQRGMLTKKTAIARKAFAWKCICWRRQILFRLKLLSIFFYFLMLFPSKTQSVV